MKKKLLKYLGLLFSAREKVHNNFKIKSILLPIKNWDKIPTRETTREPTSELATEPTKHKKFKLRL